MYDVSGTQFKQPNLVRLHLYLHLPAVYFVIFALPDIKYDFTELNEINSFGE